MSVSKFFRTARSVDSKLGTHVLCNPATGQDSAPVKALRRALGQATECPTCGGVGTLGKRGYCADDWHKTCGK